MEEQKNIQDFLELISQPGFCVKDGHILHVNRAAQVLMLAPGQEMEPLLQTGREEYRQFENGQLYLSLKLGNISRNASVLRMEDWDLFLLDAASDSEEFRSMGLVSMELRSPLMSVISSAQQLLNQLEPENTEAAAKLNKGLAQLLRLTSNLSDVERYRESCHMETRDICSVLEELLEKSQVLTAGSGIRLSWELPREAIPCLIDSEQIERAVWNLISNAVKFLSREGAVHVKLTRHGQRLYLTVADSGSGIAEQVRSTVFQRYLRQPGIEDSRFGLGLGMVIVRTAAANHGGTVLIEQNGDSGTRVTMTLSLRQNTENKLQSPMLRPDYSSGWDHGLVELSDCLPAEFYKQF